VMRVVVTTPVHLSIRLTTLTIQPLSDSENLRWEITSFLNLCKEKPVKIMSNVNDAGNAKK